MIKIEASGKSFAMGTNDSSANIDEKPSMPVTFSYDYWLDTTEVTQSEFQSITGTNPIPDSTRYGKGASYPVYFVSWFDAALYCNAKSKRLGLDTVYSYYKINSNSSGSVYDLVGVRTHYEKDGLRLPTEAEWEFAASGETYNDSALVSSRAWYITNSNGMTHSTAMKSPNGFGLYDMAGNVFEWTGDWKASHVAHPITNPIGAEEHDQQFERVIKGGSFKNDLYNLRPTSRSATYPTAASSSCEYVGFRCARGIIPNPAFVSLDTTLAASNPVDMVIGDMHPILGTSLAKLVFVNVTRRIRTLCYIDYSEPQPQIHEFTDMSAVYLPTVSPDGRYVAFCTQSEGFGDSSSIYIRSLDSTHTPLARLASDFAYAPHWWVNKSTGDTFIVYTNSSIDNKLTEWSTTKTMLQKVTGGKPSGDPTTLVADGSFHDGLSQNGQYAATGFTRLLMRDLASGEQRQLFVSPLNGKGPTGSTQVCNVSICPDSGHNDRCMFLDFGSTTSTLVGSSYGVHQYIFIADFSGKVVSWLKCPDNENAWDYPKWSTNERFAVSAARNAADQCHAIYSVNLQLSTSARLVEGTEIQQPYLWVSPNVSIACNISLDSAGQYATPFVHVTQERFAFRMQGYWHHSLDAQYVFLGSSHTDAAIDPNSFSRQGVFNMAYPQGEMPAAFSIMNNYLPHNSPNVRLVAMDILIGLMWYKPMLELQFTSTIGQSNGYLFDQSHGFWPVGVSQCFQEAVNSTNYPSWCDTLGGAKPSSNGWGSAQPDIIYSCGPCLLNDPVYLFNRDYIQKQAEKMDSLRIHWLLYTTPEDPLFSPMGFAGRYGPSLDAGKATVQFFRQLEAAHPYFHFYDGNNFGNHDYGDADAHDPDHLSEQGAAKFSRRIDSLIGTFGIK
jgi:uncharacterized protein (TIGR02171 family)